MVIIITTSIHHSCKAANHVCANLFPFLWLRSFFRAFSNQFQSFETIWLLLVKMSRGYFSLENITRFLALCLQPFLAQHASSAFLIRAASLGTGAALLTQVGGYKTNRFSLFQHSRPYHKSKQPRQSEVWSAKSHTYLPWGEEVFPKLSSCPGKKKSVLVPQYRNSQLNRDPDT